jgi:6-phosphofructokinase 1
MGRHAGFLTAASTLARKYSDDGPHLVYLPERTFDVDQFLLDVKNVYDRLGRCVIAVSEGIHDANNTPIMAKLMQNVEHDAHGNIQLSGTGALADLLTDSIKNNLNIKRVRADTFGYLQRSFAGCVSHVDQREAREAGIKAVQYAIWSDTNGTIAIQRIGDYAVEYKKLPLTAVAAKTRIMPDTFIVNSGNDVTDAFRNYLQPLLGSDMPSMYRLQASSVGKILNV